MHSELIAIFGKALRDYVIASDDRSANDSLHYSFGLRDAAAIADMRLYHRMLELTGAAIAARRQIRIADLMASLSPEVRAMVKVP